MRTALALVLACFSAHAAEEIFRCKGEDGVTTYSSKPCGPDAQPVTLRAEPPPTATVDTTLSDFYARQAAEKAQAAADLEARKAADAATTGCNAEVYSVQQELEEVRASDPLGGSVSWTYAGLYVAAEAEQRKTDRVNALETQERALRASCQAIWQSAYQAKLQAK